MDSSYARFRWSRLRSAQHFHNILWPPRLTVPAANVFFIEFYSDLARIESACSCLGNRFAMLIRRPLRPACEACQSPVPVRPGRVPVSGSRGTEPNKVLAAIHNRMPAMLSDRDALE